MALGPVMKMRMMMMMVMMAMMGGDSDEETTKNEQMVKQVEEGGSCGAQMVSKNKWRWRIEKQEIGTYERIQRQGEDRRWVMATSACIRHTKTEIKVRSRKPGLFTLTGSLVETFVSTYAPTSIASPALVSVAVTTTAGS